MRKVKIEAPNRCWLWHRWRLVEDTGANAYHECRRCGSRFVRSIEGADYQPLDIAWLIGAHNNRPKDAA
jgi:hypothetical protein